MPNPHLHHLVICMDTSASMLTIKSRAESGLRRLLEEQRTLPALTTVTLWQFASNIRHVFDTLPLAQIPDVALRPKGRTALLDTIGRALSELEDSLETTPEAWQPRTITMVIVTDGRDNESKDYTPHRIQRMIGDRRRKGWQFVYVAADADAFTRAAEMGIGRETVLPTEPDTIEESMTSAGRMISRGGLTGSYRFTDDERDATG